MARTAVTLVLSGFLLAVLAQPAFAHAALEMTEPARGSTIADSPAVVRLVFNEPVQTRFGGIRVFDGDLNRVDRGAPTLEGPDTVTIGLKDLPEGSYSVAWKVISDDAHPVQGAFTFSVGTNAQAPNAGLDAALTEFGTVGMPVRIMAGGARFLGYVTSLILMGSVLFLLISWRPKTPGGTADLQMARQTRRLLLKTWPYAALASVLLLATQAATESAGGLFSGFSPSNFGPVLAGHFGLVWKFRVLLLILMIPATLRLEHRSAGVPLEVRVSTVGAEQVLPLPGPVFSRKAARLLLVLTAGLTVTPAFWGHSNAVEGRGLAIASDVVHALTVAAWIGGLVVLLFVVPRAMKGVDGEERAGSMALTVPRFSTVAFISVVLLTLAGTYLSVVHVKSWANLFGTTYGKLIVAKIVGLALTLALAGYNLLKTRKELARFADSPEDSERWSAKLRKAVRGEVMITGVVIALAAVLVSVPPSAGAGGSAPETYVAQATMGTDLVSITVFPARVGTLTQVHATLLNPDGSPDTGIIEPKVIFTQVDQNLGPFEYDGLILAPGHFTVTNIAFPVPGKWSMHMIVTKDKFESLEHTFTFNVG